MDAQPLSLESSSHSDGDEPRIRDLPGYARDATRAATIAVLDTPLSTVASGFKGLRSAVAVLLAVILLLLLFVGSQQR